VVLLRRAGHACQIADNGSRELFADDPDGGLRFLLAKSADVPVYVEYGAADIGIVGEDALWESGRDVYAPLQLGFGHCRLVLAGEPSFLEVDLRQISSTRVASKYPRLASEYLREKGITAEIIPLTGSVELAPCVGLADLLVDLVQTGQTLRENGLIELDQILSCQATVIVNRVSHRLRLAEIRALLAGLEQSKESLS
jgi:ATP phosphoribosyltransferase